MKPIHRNFSLRLLIPLCLRILRVFILPCIFVFICVLAFSPASYALPASQFPLKEIFSKKPMKVDSALKSKAVQVKVRRRSGISTMIRYNYDEYTTEEVKHKGTAGWEFYYGFIIYAGKGATKTGFSYMLTDHQDDTAMIYSALVMNTKFTRAYFAFKGMDMEFESLNKSTDIYASNLHINGDTSKWEIMVMDKLRFRDSIVPAIVGTITNGERKFLVRLVAEFEDGEKAGFMPPGFEIRENENTLMAVQFNGDPARVPIVWIDPGIDRRERFILITAASSLISRMNEVMAQRTGD